MVRVAYEIRASGHRESHREIQAVRKGEWTGGVPVWQMMPSLQHTSTFFSAAKFRDNRGVGHLLHSGQCPVHVGGECQQVPPGGVPQALR